MSDAASAFFSTLTSIASLQALIDAGEAESVYLECKAPSSPSLSREQKANLARAISGFANTVGGVIIWGLSTTRHAHSDLDILTQIEPIGNIASFSRHVANTIPTLTTPSVASAQIRVLKSKTHETRGALVTYIPQLHAGPVQSNLDNLFYFRSGDEFVVAPYDLVRRLFSSTEAPDLRVHLEPSLVKKREDGSWEIPLAVRNFSPAIAEHVDLFIEMHNPSACETISAQSLDDGSAVNPGKTVFTKHVTRIIHRGPSYAQGILIVKMRVGKRPKRVLRFAVTLYANRMLPVVQTFTIQLARKGFSIKEVITRTKP